MIGRLLGINPLLLTGALFLAMIAASALTIGSKNRTINLLRAETAVLTAKLEVSRMGTFALESEIEAQNDAVDEMQKRRERDKALYASLRRVLDGNKARHIEALEELKLEQGVSCHDGISLIDRELGL